MNVAALARSKRIWYFFIKMCEICRISGEETNLQKFIADFARSHNLAFQTDAVGNIMVTREKNPQCSSTKTTLLQAHMDMVPRIADGFDFDFKPYEYTRCKHKCCNDEKDIIFLHISILSYSTEFNG